MHVVSGTLRKETTVKQLAESTMYIIELSEMVKDFKTGEKTYSNYKAMLFAKSAAAIEYYNQALTVGSFVVVNSEKLKVETFDANSGKTYITLMMDNAKLEAAHFDSNQAPQPQAAPAYNQAPQQPAYQQPAYQQPAYQQPAHQQAPRQTPVPNNPATGQTPQQPVYDETIPF